MRTTLQALSRRLGLLIFLAGLTAARGEVILQYFNTSWTELAYKMPELAEAGYGAIWLPPPTKGSGGLSVGYDLWDSFDLGSKDQRSTIKTRYGTEAELIRLIETAHRFGIRVYFDNIMNHRAFDVPGYNENTPLDVYPGLVPEDFHLRVTEDGFYRKWDNVDNWNDSWQVQNRNFSDLIDIAHETPNANFGYTEGSTHPKPSFVRQPYNPELYDFMPSPTGGPSIRVGFYSTNITAGLIASNQSFYSEDVGGFLIRSVRWLMDRTKVDGLRLDAVKHVPSYFFGEYNNDTSSAGYVGAAQQQFNITRGFSDSNHRDTVFDTDKARDDAMMFGEHLGSPPGYGEYTAVGMRLVDSTLKGKLNGLWGVPGTTLSGLDQPGVSGDAAFNQFTGVMFAKSHDDDYVSRPELHYGFYLTRQGLPNIYTDGNYQSETLAQSGGAFPRHANTAFLGQFSDNRIPNLVYIHNHFARGDQIPKYSDDDVIAYERRDKRENGGMGNEDGTTLLFMLNDNYASGQGRAINTTFGHVAFSNDAYLCNYSTYGGSFYVYASQIANGSVIIPPGGYFAFSWRTPEESDLWKGLGGKPVTVLENGQLAGSLSYERRDGPNGDPAFNPYGAADSNTTDYAYTWSVPRVTTATNLQFRVRADGSANNVMMKLDGGMDLNSQMAMGDTTNANYFYTKYRDRRPGDLTVNGMDMYVGYEDTRFVQRSGREKFAAKDSNRNQYGSAGSESYQAVIGTAGVTNFNASGTNDWGSTESVVFAYHDPAATVTASNQPAELHFNPAPQSAGGSSVSIWVKAGYENNANKAYIYYTTDGATFPEGADGLGIGNTKVAEMFYVADDQGSGTIDWWRGTLPAMTNGTVLRYKIGMYRAQNGSGSAPWYVPFPVGATEVAKKKVMLGEWDVASFNAATNVYYPHNDYGRVSTGLVEGFHVLNARVFLDRGGRAALFNTFTQPFYMDAYAPTGRIVYPANDYDDLASQEYGAVVRSDTTVTKVYFHIDDNNPLNDDGQTGNNNGNGTNAAGQAAWGLANSELPSTDITSPYPLQWRFTYRNIPASGVATMQVKLAELSSSTNPLLSDAAGRFGTLTRLADCFAPTQKLFIAYPSNDGDLINDTWDYGAKTWFSKSMDSNVTNFLVRIDGSTVAQSALSINYNVGDYHELFFTLPDLYNGDSNYLHHIEVVYTSNGGVTYQAHRYIRAYSQASGPYVSIVTPPEVDSVGQPFVIELPDVASPTPAQRQYPIRVETDLSASNVWIEFAGSAGTAYRLPSIESATPGLVGVVNGSPSVSGQDRLLSGTVVVILSNATVTGAGTLFSNEVAAGQSLLIGGNSVVISQVVSQTQLLLSQDYPANSATGLAVYQQPRFDVNYQSGNQIKISGQTYSVSAVPSATNLVLASAWSGSTASGLAAYRVDPNPSQISSSRRQWDFMWTNILSPGSYTFYARVDTNGVTNTVEATATRNATVIFRQTVAANDSDIDDDDDGLSDYSEMNSTNGPWAYQANSELWENGQVHIYNVYGKTKDLSPDTDGDGLPDGLESGWRTAIAGTDTNADTNGDGWKNYIPDLDPPFYNTLDNYGSVPGVNSQTEGGDRARLVRGTTTNPNNPDSDYDGIPDGVEDRDRNGWVNGDGELLPADWNPWLARNWPTRTWTTAWTETDPNNNDTDQDGASDGYGEDKNFNGAIDGDTNSNRIWNAGELWTETNPLNPDTDGDGLPDGWEVQYGLDPWDDGVVGHTNLNSGLAVSNTANGAFGNPDGDVVCSTSNAYYNLLEYQNNSNPRQFDSCAPIPEGSIIIGRSTNVLGVINGVTNYAEFTDWTWDDLVVLDEYEGDGNNNQGGDEYLAWDGYDTSRDIVAFYARDGGPDAGQFYFRVDVHDLQPLAEEGYLDLYVAMDFNSPNAGEMALPDDVDLVTSMRWECVVAAYQSGQGAVYVDTNPTSNSTLETQGGILNSFGVQRRDQASANGFKASYYNSELDAIEFSISRQALLDAGWNGNADSINYQVFSTKDGTCNSCGTGGKAGDGDIGGRNDVRDTIYDDHVAEDYWNSQASIQNALVNYFNRSTFAGRSKVAMLVHGNQAIQPGSVMQNLINNGQGAGYGRLLDIHDIYQQPVNLHVTASLASALQWASVDPAAGTPWRDGPAFNARLAQLVSNGTVRLLASTFSDHAMPYFTPQYNADNVALAKEFLGDIYGAGFNSTSVFWTPERILDADVFAKIQNLGHYWTVIDQDTHVSTWLGRNVALGEGGYKINRINGVKCFAINDGATAYRFLNTDGGLPTALRSLFNRKARAYNQNQVVTMLSNWEDFATKASADNYDRNIRWIANHPWVKLVGLQDIAANQVDLSGDGNGDDWGYEERGSAATNKISHNFVQHASQGNVDNWYVGSTLEQGLQTNQFAIRGGIWVNQPYGMQYFGGVSSSAWSEVLATADTNLSKLARSVYGASTFETAFHNEDNNNLEKYSIGTYVYPDTTYDTLADFSKQAQAQTRTAALMERVDDWMGAAASITNTQAAAEDVDLDGEDEYVLFNDRLFGVFEKTGGRLIGAWVRDILRPTSVFQALGNQASFAGSETEDEGAYSVQTNGTIVAYRTSGLKDWFANGDISYNNMVYSFTNVANGWQITSSNGLIRKTVTLAPKAWAFQVQYQTFGALAGQALYVRNGLSPNLYDLLVHGQRTLGGLTTNAGVLQLANTNYYTTVAAQIGLGSAGYNATALDDNPGAGVNFYTIPMRNQAQTHQVELVGTNSFTFSLGFRAFMTDSDGDGIPNAVEEGLGLSATNAADGAADADGDKVNNANEWIAGTSPNSATDYLHAVSQATTNVGIYVRWPSKDQREYRIYYADQSLVSPTWSLATSNAIPGTNGVSAWLDDGTATAPHPFNATNRFYQIKANLPE